ncbi:MptD family putative ECF transporter S component [Planomonospora sp. ID91781]|uniref:MptD family putative ECF transporter S component n=1 Tax=Planomonospora sp. ID91781 TaxID=2738135 RepID=UPI0018C3FB32|nr:MptD family putative ECF transporter S component [Planomonospora sp. ID91781]
MTALTPARRRFDVRMSPKDLIDIGVFGALYLVVVFGINMLGFLNPAVMLAALVASIVAGGVPFMLFLTRVSHAGMVTVFAIITAGILMLTGHPLISFLISVGCALVAEVIVRVGRYRSRRLSVLAYAVYSAWYAGPMMPIFYDREAYFSGPSVQMMGADYVSQMQALLSPPVLVAFDVSTIVFGLLGGLLGLRLMRKHFEKAGLA